MSEVKKAADEPVKSVREISRDYCEAVMPADLFAKIRNCCPEANWEKIMGLINSPEGGTKIIEAYLALNL